MISKYLLRFFLPLFTGVFLLASIAVAVEQVNINTADAQSLARVLSGVGEAKAAEIVRHRQQFGLFKRKEQLADVKGIGSAIVQRNLDRMQLSSGATQ